MKRILLFILIVLSYGGNAANGETWSCSYQYSNEIKNKVLIRDSNIFKDESGAIVSTYINETKDFIHIYNTIGSIVKRSAAENIPAYQIANKIAEERIESIGKVKLPL